MPIHRLDIAKLRNINQPRILPSPQVNLIVGANGSGKTSLLEAIYLLSYGRSFRSHKHKTYIQYEQDACVLFAQLQDVDHEIVPHWTAARSRWSRGSAYSRPKCPFGG